MFGKRLEQLRTELNISQGDISKALSVSDSNYSDIKKSEKDPPWIEHVKDFTKKYKISSEKLYWLITGEHIGISGKTTLIPQESQERQIEKLEQKIEKLEAQNSRLLDIIDKMQEESLLKASRDHTQHEPQNDQGAQGQHRKGDNVRGNTLKPHGKMHAPQ